MAYQAKSYGRVYHNLYHLVPLYKRAKKDVGKNQAFQAGDEWPEVCELTSMPLYLASDPLDSQHVLGRSIIGVSHGIIRIVLGR